MIWKEIKGMFNIPDEKVYKTAVLFQVSTSWKSFKGSLYRTFIKNGPPKNKLMPYEDGTCTKEDWDIFYKWHTSEEFKKISLKAAESKKHDKNPHRMGSRSYAQNEVIWNETQAYSGLSFMNKGVKGLKRSGNYILARRFKNENGEYVLDEKNMRIAEKMDDWCEKELNEEFTPSGHDDNLNRSVERTEHPGQVVGVGSNTGIKAYFGASKCRIRKTKSFMDDPRVQEALKTMLDERIEKLMQSQQFVKIRSPNVSSSCQSASVDHIAGYKDFARTVTYKYQELNEVIDFFCQPIFMNSSS